jgi:hypothetical protein
VTPSGTPTIAGPFLDGLRRQHRKSVNGKAKASLVLDTALRYGGDFTHCMAVAISVDYT